MNPLVRTAPKVTQNPDILVRLFPCIKDIVNIIQNELHAQHILLRRSAANAITTLRLSKSTSKSRNCHWHKYRRAETKSAWWCNKLICFFAFLICILVILVNNGGFFMGILQNFSDLRCHVCEKSCEILNMSQLIRITRSLLQLQYNRKLVN